MDGETAKRISDELYQVRVVSEMAWFIIHNCRKEVGTTGALTVLKDALARFERYSRKIRREIDVLMPLSKPKVATPVLRFTHREHPRSVRHRCRGVRRDEKPCSNRVEAGSAFCRHHQEQASQGSLDEIAALVVKLGHLLP